MDVPTTAPRVSASPPVVPLMCSGAAMSCNTIVLSTHMSSKLILSFRLLKLVPV